MLPTNLAINIHIGNGIRNTKATPMTRTNSRRKTAMHPVIVRNTATAKDIVTGNGVNDSKVTATRHPLATFNLEPTINRNPHPRIAIMAAVQNMVIINDILAGTRNFLGFSNHPRKVQKMPPIVIPSLLLLRGTNLQRIGIHIMKVSTSIMVRNNPMQPDSRHRSSMMSRGLGITALQMIIMQRIIDQQLMNILNGPYEITSVIVAQIVAAVVVTHRKPQQLVSRGVELPAKSVSNKGIIVGSTKCKKKAMIFMVVLYRRQTILLLVHLPASTKVMVQAEILVNLKENKTVPSSQEPTGSTKMAISANSVYHMVDIVGNIYSKKTTTTTTTETTDFRLHLSAFVKASKAATEKADISNSVPLNTCV